MNSQTAEYLMRALRSDVTKYTLLEELIADGAPLEVINDIYPECPASEYERIKNEIQSNQNQAQQIHD